MKFSILTRAQKLFVAIYWVLVPLQVYEGWRHDRCWQVVLALALIPLSFLIIWKFNHPKVPPPDSSSSE